MPVDEGVRGTYLTKLRGLVASRRDLLSRAVEELRVARFEERMRAGLSPATVAVLVALGVFGRESVEEIQARRDRLIAEIRALEELLDAVGGAT